MFKSITHNFRSLVWDVVQLRAHKLSQTFHTLTCLPEIARKLVLNKLENFSQG